MPQPAEGGRGPVWLANLSYVPAPVRSFTANMSLSPGTRWLSDKEDALAAYTHALLWFITEDQRYAVKAAEIMVRKRFLLVSRTLLFTFFLLNNPQSFCA